MRFTSFIHVHIIKILKYILPNYVTIHIENILLKTITAIKEQNTHYKGDINTADRLADEGAGRQAGRQAGVRVGGRADRQADRQAGRQNKTDQSLPHITRNAYNTYIYYTT